VLLEIGDWVKLIGTNLPAIASVFFLSHLPSRVDDQLIKVRSSPDRAQAVLPRNCQGDLPWQRAEERALVMVTGGCAGGWKPCRLFQINDKIAS
jgi:hypothetical protein